MCLHDRCECVGWFVERYWREDLRICGHLWIFSKSYSYIATIIAASFFRYLFPEFRVRDSMNYIQRLAMGQLYQNSLEFTS